MAKLFGRNTHEWAKVTCPHCGKQFARMSAHLKACGPYREKLAQKPLGELTFYEAKISGRLEEYRGSR